MSPRPKLTPAQRAKVRSLVEDEGWSRAEAVAWATTFREPDPDVEIDRRREAMREAP